MSVGVGDGGQRRGVGEAEERGKKKEKILCVRERMERDCGWKRRILYIMAAVQK